MTHTHLEIVKIVSRNPFLQITGIYFKFYGLRWVLLFKYVHYYIRHTVKYILLYDKCKKIKIISYTSFCLKYIMYSYCEVKKIQTSSHLLQGSAWTGPSLPSSTFFAVCTPFFVSWLNFTKFFPVSEPACFLTLSSMVFLQFFS